MQLELREQRFAAGSVLGGALCVVEAARVNKTTDKSS